MNEPVSAKHLAGLFHVTQKWIERLVKEHGMPKVAHGKYPKDKCIKWYIQFLRDQISAAAAGGPRRQDAETRKMVAQADDAEIDLARKKGNLVAVDAIQRIIEPFIESLVAKLQSLDRYAPILTNLSQDKITDELRSISRDLSADITALPVQLYGRESSEGDAAGHGGKIRAKAPAHRKRMGGKISVVKR